MPRPNRTKEDDVQPNLQTLVMDICSSRDFITQISGIITEVIEKNYNEKIKALEQENKTLTAKVSNLEKINAAMQLNYDNTEQLSKMNCLRIFGVPEQNKENIEETVMNIFKNKLGLTNITYMDIDRSARSGKIDKEKPRAIFVKFISYKMKLAVFKQKKKLKDSGITIREDLTKLRQNLLNEALKKFDFHDVWTYNGIICIKVGEEIKRIHSNVELANL